MKCPVCDQENTTMLCTRCGFDSSHNYGQYPTLAPVKRTPSISARRRQWQSTQSKPISKPSGPQHVDYQKMVSQYAKEDQMKREQLHQPSVPITPTPNTHYREVTPKEAMILTTSQQEIDTLYNKFDYHQKLAKSTPNQKLEDNQRLQAELQAMRRRLDEEKGEKLKLHQKLKELADRILLLEQENRALAAELQIARNKINEREANPKTSQNKGILGRLFNR